MVDPIDASRQVELEKIRLVEADFAHTNEFIKGVLTTGAALRGSAITIWLALVGFAVQQDIPALAILAALVAGLFWIADGYHGWLYGQAFMHAQRIERLLASYYDTLSRRQDSQRAQIKFAGKLRAHRFGLYIDFTTGFSLRQLWRGARPRLFYRYLYPALVLLALGGATFLAFNVASDSPGTTRVIIERDPETSSTPSSTQLPRPRGTIGLFIPEGGVVG